jgi:N-acetylneuraminic acid mutarotase
VKIAIAAAMLLLAACTKAPLPPSDAPPLALPPGWTALSPLPVGVGEAAVAAHAGKVYVAGGFDTRRDFQIYDVATDRWQVGPKLPLGTDNAGAIAIGETIVVFGGEGTPAVLVYDVAAGTWTRGPALPSPRFASVVEAIGAEVHLVGGWSFDRADNVSLVSHDVFDPAAGTYAARAAAPTPRNHATAGVIAGKLYVTGGRAPGHEAEDADNVTVTEVYDPATDAWQALAPLPTPRSGGAGVVLGDKLYVLGGGLPGNAVTATVERFDPATGAWEHVGDMPEAATGHRAVAIDGAIYVFAGFVTVNGERQGVHGSDRAWRFTPP